MAWEESSRICLHMQLIAILSRTGVFYKMILAEDTTNPTFYAYFRGFMALFLGFGLKVKL